MDDKLLTPTHKGEQITATFEDVCFFLSSNSRLILALKMMRGAKGPK